MFYFNTFLAVATFYEVVIDVGGHTYDNSLRIHFSLRATRSPDRFEKWCSI